MVSSILTLYGRCKAERLLKDFEAAVTGFEADIAGKAESLMLQAEHRKLEERLGEAEAEMSREHGETEELQQIYHWHLYAAKVLHHELDHVDDDERRHDLMVGLTTLLDQIERHRPGLIRGQRGSHDALVWAARLRFSVDMLTKKLERSGIDLRSDQRNTQRREVDRKPSAAATLKTALLAISFALASMNKKAWKAHADAEALERRLKALQSQELDQDRHIATALRTKPATTFVEPVSLHERIGRLEDRPATATPSAA